MLLLDKSRAACLPEITYPEDSGKHKHSHMLMKTSLQLQVEQWRIPEAQTEQKFLSSNTQILLHPSKYIDPIIYNPCLKVG